MNNIKFIITTKEPLPPEGSIWERKHLTGNSSESEYPICKLGTHHDYSYWTQNFTMQKSKYLTGICFKIESKGLVTKPLKIGISNKLIDPLDQNTQWLAYGELPPVGGERFVTCIFDISIPVIAPPGGMYYLTLITDEPHSYSNYWHLLTQTAIPDVLYMYRGSIKKWASISADMYYGKFKKI
jgi:hypothetical protein